MREMAPRSSFASESQRLGQDAAVTTGGGSTSP